MGTGGERERESDDRRLTLYEEWEGSDRKAREGGEGKKGGKEKQTNR